MVEDELESITALEELYQRLVDISLVRVGLNPLSSTFKCADINGKDITIDSFFRSQEDDRSCLLPLDGLNRNIIENKLLLPRKL